jgi:hypothetical protein
MCSGLVTFEPLCAFKGWRTSSPLLICTESWGSRSGFVADSMVDQVSYKSVRDQLVSITVDIEDKSKVCGLLERNIEKERQLLSTVDAAVREDFEHIIAVRAIVSFLEVGPNSNCSECRVKFKQAGRRWTIESNVSKRWEYTKAPRIPSIISSILLHILVVYMQLIQDKGHLIKQCNELVEAVKEQERELSTEVRTVYKDAEGSIESEKKAFRAGYEDRLHKVSLLTVPDGSV